MDANDDSPGVTPARLPQPSDHAAGSVRVVLPHHLRNLAGVGSEVRVEVADPVTPNAILDSLEASFPMLRGTIRDHSTKARRPMLRYFACGEDLSLESPDAPLPEAVASGGEPFRVVGAIAGG